MCFGVCTSVVELAIDGVFYWNEVSMQFIEIS